MNELKSPNISSFNNTIYGYNYNFVEYLGFISLEQEKDRIQS